MADQFLLTCDQGAPDIPYLELKPHDRAEDAPTVLMLHGLFARKEDQLKRMYALASEGYRVIALDARLHGERPGAETRDARLEANYHQTMYEVIAGTAADSSSLLTSLNIQDCAIHGISLGAIITFAALVTEPRLKVAITAMGNPDWISLAQSFGMPAGHPMLTALAEQSPLNLAAHTYPPRPLLMLHGALDSRISVDGVRMLYERLLPVYQDVPDRLRLVIYDDLDHVYTDEMLRESIAWLTRHYPASRL